MSDILKELEDLFNDAVIVEEAEKFPMEYPDEEEYYTPSATRGDYSPSCPWNAPGMSIHDFI